MPGIDQYTKLLLHMDGDASSIIGGNDAVTRFLCHFDTSTLVDASRINNTITNNGVTVDTNTKKFGAGSGSFNGSSYLSVPDTSHFAFGYNPFTIDFWVKLSSTSVDHSFFSFTEDGENYMTMFIDGGTDILYFYMYNGLSTVVSMSYNWSGSIDTNWHHIALIRGWGGDYTQWRIAIDGTAVTSTVDGDPCKDYTVPLWIGRYSSIYMNGNIDEFRVSKNIARWTSNFTPPTSPYGGKTVFPYGSPKLDSSTKKFGSSSMYFNGSTDYLWLSDYSDWDFGSDDFTIDFWVNFNDVSSYQTFFSARFNATVFRLRNDGRLNFYVYDNVINLDSNALSWNTGQWYHLALIRNGNSFDIYRDGVSVASTTNSSSIPDITNVVLIGAYNHVVPESFLDGYLDEFRISKGIARWTSNFTPPTAEYETDEYAVLLLHFPGDMSESNHPITFSSQVRIDVSPTKWSGSFYFDGADDYISIPDSEDWNFGSDYFTVEFWMKRNVADVRHTPIYQCDSGATASSTSFGVTIKDDNKVYFRVCSGSTLYDAISTGTVGTEWYHIACVRDGNTLRLFINGTQDGTADVTGVTINNSTYPLVVGRTGQYSAAELFNGFLDELRIVKGEALYTSNFTPQTEPFTIYRISGDISDDMRILAIRETDWQILENTTVSGSSYDLSFTGSDPITIVGRRSDGKSQGYGNIIPS